jgi:hypothetical protein
MKIEAKGEIYNMSLCSTDKENSDPLQEISLNLHFKAIDYPEIISMDKEQVEKFFADGVHRNITMGKGSPILRKTFNINIDGEEFVGESFSSATASMVKKIGAVIKLHATLIFSETLWNRGPKISRKMIAISFKEINEQLELPNPTEDDNKDQEKAPF